MPTRVSQEDPTGVTIWPLIFLLARLLPGGRGTLSETPSLDIRGRLLSGLRPSVPHTVSSMLSNLMTLTG